MNGLPISDYVIGHIRTYTPMVVGALIVWLTDGFGIEVEAGAELALATGLTSLVSAVYYGVVRFVAKALPWAGVLLGYNQKPAYFEPVEDAPA